MSLFGLVYLNLCIGKNTGKTVCGAMEAVYDMFKSCFRDSLYENSLILFYLFL